MEQERVNFDRIAVEEAPQAERLAEWITREHGGVVEQNVPQWANLLTIFDVGCGPGTYVEALRQRGWLYTHGLDNDARMPTGDRYHMVDITQRYDLGVMADIVICLEVLEHIPRSLEERAAQYLRDCSASLIYFSAARPGQGGEGHINLRYRWEWARLLANEGFAVDYDFTQRWLQFMASGYHLGWLTQNGMVFRR